MSNNTIKNHFLIEKEKKRQKMLDQRFKQAWHDFDAIIQWGSFTELSDIDISIEGILSPEIMFKIYGDILDLSDFPVDIVQMEKIAPEFVDIIREKGKIIYERTNCITD